jgi:hypothetical protein
VTADRPERRAACALRVPFVDQILPEAPELLVGERARVGRPEDDGVGRLTDGREVGDLAAVHVVRALEEHAALHA